MNEPWLTSIAGYGAGNFPPGSAGLGSLGTDVYQVTHNIIKAHARAYRVYHEEFAANQNGECGLQGGIDYWSTVLPNCLHHKHNVQSNPTAQFNI